MVLVTIRSIVRAVGGAIDEEVDEESRDVSFSVREEYKLDRECESNKPAGRDAINSGISRNHKKGSVILVAVSLPTLAICFSGKDGINTTLALYVVLTGLCYILRSFLQVSRVMCPFCGERNQWSMVEKFKVGKEHLFCQRCGVSIDEEV